MARMPSPALISSLDAETARLKKAPLWFYVQQNKRSFALGMTFLLLTNSLDSIYPLFIKTAVDQVANKVSLADIRGTALTFLGVMSLLAITRYFWRVFFGAYHTDAAEDLRNRIFQHLIQMGPRFFKRNPVGELLSVIINDVQSFRNGIGSGVLVFADGLMIITLTLPIMIWLNPQWAWQTLILLPAVPLLIRKLTNLIFQSYKIQQDKLGELSGVSQETVAGIRVIKSFALEDHRLEHYKKFSSAYEKACNRTALWEALFGPVMQFGVASGSVILLFVAGPDVIKGVATVGTLIAFQRYIQKMTWPMTALGLGLSQFQKGRASLTRITDILDQPSDLVQAAQQKPVQFQSLKIQNLSYQYDDGQAPVLKDLDFQLSAGEFVALVGPVGSGKSTLLHLLARLYPVTQGQILLNEIPLADIDNASLRDLLTFVTQEAFLFSDTIADNLSFGLPQRAETDLLWDMANTIQMANEIRAWPEQLNTSLGERGVNLSGGQKQRLTLARSLAVTAPLVLLDDTFSAIDTDTEARVKKVLLANKNRRTLLVVAHRLSTIAEADRIIVLNQGQIEAIGQHADLLRTSPTYAAMARMQGVGAQMPAPGPSSGATNG